MFLASSIAAFLRETRRVQLIEDGEIVAITPDGVRFCLRRRRGARASATSMEVDWDDEAAEKQGYETFMLKEIYEQPQAVADTIGDRVRGGRLELDDLGLTDVGDPEPPAHGHPRLRHGVPRGRRRPLRDRGVGAHPVRARHRERVALPQPGALQGHPRRRHLAVRRDPRHAAGCPARARERRAHARDHEPHGHADHARGRPRSLHARGHGDGRRGHEDVHVAGGAPLPARRSSSRRSRDAPGGRDRRACSARCSRCRRRSRTYLDGDHPIEEIAQRHYQKPFFLYLGRHIGLPVCLEGALKLKEISYIPTEAYSAGEMKHGPIALLDEETPVVCRRHRLARLRQGRLQHPGGPGARGRGHRDRHRRERGHPAPRRRRRLRAARRIRSCRRRSPWSRSSCSRTGSPGCGG